MACLIEIQKNHLANAPGSLHYWIRITGVVIVFQFLYATLWNKENLPFDVPKMAHNTNSAVFFGQKSHIGAVASIVVFFH